MSEDGRKTFIVPLGPKARLKITGRVAKGDVKPEDYDKPVISLAHYVWGDSIEMTNRPLRKHGADTAVFAEDAVFRLEHLCEYNPECTADADQAVFINVPKDRDYWLMCMEHARMVCP